MPDLSAPEWRTPRPDPAPRLDMLEIRIAHQDRMIEDLSATIADQWRFVEGLARHIAMLDERMRDSSMVPSAGQEPPPPHY